MCRRCLLPDQHLSRPRRCRLPLGASARHARLQEDTLCCLLLYKQDASSGTAALRMSNQRKKNRGGGGARTSALIAPVHNLLPAPVGQRRPPVARARLAPAGRVVAEPVACAHKSCDTKNEKSHRSDDTSEWKQASVPEKPSRGRPADCTRELRECCRRACEAELGVARGESAEGAGGAGPDGRRAQRQPPLLRRHLRAWKARYGGNVRVV